MSNQFDVIIGQQYEQVENGKTETKTKWNRVGRAWRGKTGDSINFELFLMPGNRYVIKTEDRDAFESRNPQL